MNQTLRSLVLIFLQALPESKHDQFNEAYEFYKQSEGKNLSVERNLNRVGYTDTGLENLLYDLQKMYNISDLEIADKPIIAFAFAEQDLAKEAAVKKILEDFDGLTEDSRNAILLNLKINNEFPNMSIVSEVLANDLTKSEEYLTAFINTESVWEELNFTAADIMQILSVRVKDFEYPEDLKEQIEELRIEKTNLTKPLMAVVAEKIVEHTEAFDEDKKYVTGEELEPVREEFPFLNDDNCPEVFFIVVGKKISAYRKWQAAQQELLAIENKEQEATPEHVKDLAVIAEANFRENQELYNELNHYAGTGEILGAHPLFRESVSKREVEAMTVEQLTKYRNSSSKFFTDKKKLLIKHAADAVKVSEINQQIDDRKYKLELVNAKLGINDAKK